MKNLTRFSVLAATLLAAAVIFASSSGAARQESAQEHDEAETPLAATMQILEDGLKTLRRSVRDPERNAESLECVAKMQAATLECKAMQPVMTPKVAEAEQVAFLKGYRKEMARVLGELVEMEIALLDGEQDQAREVYKNLKRLEDSGHESFTEDG